VVYSTRFFAFLPFVRLSARRDWRLAVNQCVHLIVSFNFFLILSLVGGPRAVKRAG